MDGLELFRQFLADKYCAYSVPDEWITCVKLPTLTPVEIASREAAFDRGEHVESVPVEYIPQKLGMAVAISDEDIREYLRDHEMDRGSALEAAEKRAWVRKSMLRDRPFGPYRVSWDILASVLKTDRAKAAAKSDPDVGTKNNREEPVSYLFDWPAILTALGLKSSDSEARGRVKQANERFSGPILTGGQGKRPKVNKAKLIEWWNSLEAEWQSDMDKERDKRATTESQHPHGREGIVAPDIGGSVKRRRQGPPAT